MYNREYYEQAGVAMTCRSYGEYERMFASEWTAAEQTSILDVGGGASSFSAGARARGIKVTAADPLYRLSLEEITLHGFKELEEAESKLLHLTHKFDWAYYGSVESHERIRRESLQLFLNDYKEQSDTGAYVAALLPDLPFADNSFSHVYCSHFLFLYAEQFGYDFHLAALRELSRVCRKDGEVRVYPLLDLKWREYPQLDRLLEALREYGLEAALMPSRLPFIPGSNRLLRITNNC